VPATIYTIGHSTRTLDELIEVLRAHGIKVLADVRKFPGSRRLPWFNAPNLAATLPQAGIDYRPFTGLGGRRKALQDSPNAGWRNDSFRGYADYMQTPQFAAALIELMEIAARSPTAIMCAEAVPWRCHRSLIADALAVAGWRVLQIQSRKTARVHRRTPFLKVRRGRLL